MKARRIENRALLDYVKTLPCLACRKVPSEPDHITTRGAGGGDVSENIWSLCNFCHRLRHNKGLGYMVRTYPACRYWLELAGRQDILDRIKTKGVI